MIDDAITTTPRASDHIDNGEDLIWQIVHWFESEWKMPFVKQNSLPHPACWPNLLRSASFVLLDWRLWGTGDELGTGGETLKLSVIQDIMNFLKCARENLVPVFILTNEDPEEVKEELNKLPKEVYDGKAPGNNFVFVVRKTSFWSGTEVDVAKLREWVYGNASVYALKTWHRVLDDAKSELFQAMCRRSVNWPRVFWQTYRTDGAEPSASLTNLISDSMQGRMRVDAFHEEHLGEPTDDVSADELRRLIAETSFRTDSMLPAEEVRCGDLYAGSRQRYWLNLRPDCDCIPRNGGDIADIEIYCVQGKRLRPSELQDKFSKGHFLERVSEAVVFGVHDGNSILFQFDKLLVFKYSELKEIRIGRLLHPYVTRVQQRYALYTQRQALPRIPDAAVHGTTAPSV
ncbi:MAG: hypothetical protein OXH87_08140 [Rhodospirillaceae bacterium]|nr:hypothetical protein [Rhodospirillaceae bacterium]